MSSSRLLELVPERLLAMPGYHLPQLPAATARLDANESPHPLEADEQLELSTLLGSVPLHRYPDPGCGALREAVAAAIGCAPGQLLFGNGSDELIHLLVSTFARPRPGRAAPAVLYPWPAFVVFRSAAIVHGAEPVEVPLDPRTFELDADRLLERVRETRPNVLFFPRPNNPTGAQWPAEVVHALLAAAPDTLVVVDEAYGDYAGETLLPLVARHPNLAIMRTLSKVGGAALRVGYLVLDPALAAELDKVRQPYNIGALNQTAALWILRRHTVGMQRHVASVVAERARLVAALGARAYPTAANFVLFRADDAAATWRSLADAGVLVRKFDPAGPLAGCLRVTVGTPEENDQFLAALPA